MVVVIFFALSVTLLVSCSEDEPTLEKIELENTSWKITKVNTDEVSASTMFSFMFAIVEVRYDFNEESVYQLTVTSPDSITNHSGSWSINATSDQITIDGETSDLIQLNEEFLEIGTSNVVMSGLAGGAGFEAPEIYSIVFEPF